ncbi:hypothetical protein HKD27_11035 [Gluconobacter sp. R75690]|uniref:reverse transcriptase domain-containing protein n=1 Tax=unclassified Gluconobacter TaxID=2644261 RepID=UPI00188D40DF|nr:MULTISPECIES: reverse transcriptase domain-containing protein [unclassified Gluconobacter]MBF0851451.1 hypothetical protein [Gluconobacter sp. R75690]MBF0880068.1 hypothetical protein [Gluconobacter sp. R75828]
MRWPDVLPPFATVVMSSDFRFERSDLKQYPHFDAPIALKEIHHLVTNPERVASNSFYPFFMYFKEWQPFRLKAAGRPEKKQRPIRYGARRDAYIFSYYRQILSDLYEKKLIEYGIEDCPVAYRKIKKKRGGGKCNIDFAKDAFDEIDRLKDCLVICLDIKGYFESLDHNLIKKVWCELLNVKQLPKDHYAVFKNITKYRYVDQRAVYKRLGFFGIVDSKKPSIEGHVKDIPKQLCSPFDFRNKICGKDKSFGPSLIEKNEFHYGIPQGAPISDIIANFYLMKFDKTLNEYAQRKGGKYIRYSDDILLIIPGGTENLHEAVNLAIEDIKKYGDEIEIKKSKTCIVKFFQAEGRLLYTPIDFDGIKNTKQGIEYLGFRYDGNKVYIRESTVSRFFRKISSASKMQARKHVEKNLGKNQSQLINSFDYAYFYGKYGKVHKEKYIEDDYRSWTFYSYVKRSSEIFGDKGSGIHGQFSGFKKFTEKKVKQTIKKIVPE